ncbi:hypothetical protein V8G54_019479 [Vigna mungo]|uniref:Transposase (putative) gypsy type domain-containing protein n=1 Tax=Vigna mungo TaxID=3915 RepID=A0AAQ3NCP7_VIGMU
MYILASETDANNIKLVVYKMNERACHVREGYNSGFFFVHLTLFRDLGVRLPFFDFQMGILHMLDVEPTQLHPDGWAFMQAFSIVCTALALTPTHASFLYFFHALSHPNKP